MGFWGTVVVARSDDPIDELEGLRPVAEYVDLHVRGEDGWQTVWLHRAPDGWVPPLTGDDRERPLTALLAQTGHPVLACPRIIHYLDPVWRRPLEEHDEDDLPEDLDGSWRSR